MWEKLLSNTGYNNEEKEKISFYDWPVLHVIIEGIRTQWWFVLDVSLN